MLIEIVLMLTNLFVSQIVIEVLMTMTSSSVDFVWAFERDYVELVMVDFDYVDDDEVMMMSNVQMFDADVENEIDDVRRVDFWID